MPRDALWIALRKLGVSDQLIQCTIKSFHEAKPSIDGEVLEEIEVENGLRQGSAIWLLRTLFNRYACVLGARSKWSRNVFALKVRLTAF